MRVIDQSMLACLIPGTTHVLAHGGGEAYVYLAPDGTGHMRLASGETRSGTWQFREGGYTTEWDAGQKGDWTLNAEEGGIVYRSADGKQSVKMLGILFGNPKNLPLGVE